MQQDLKKVLQDEEKRAALIYGQPMLPCPACGSYRMAPRIPLDVTLPKHTNDIMKSVLKAWVCSQGAKLQGTAYYQCKACWHKGPAVNVLGRTSEDCRSDPALNSRMKKLWNEQCINPTKTTETATQGNQ